MNSGHLEIDGSVLEGGGQIIRLLLPLSVITGKSFRLHSIRSRRPKPGLNAQHVAAIQLVSKLNNALLGVETNLQSADLNSTEFQFDPRGGFPSPGQKALIQSGDHIKCQIELNTAGSVMLLIQAALPVALFANHIRSRHGQSIGSQASSISSVQIDFLGGGTHVDFSPTSDYYQQILLPFLRNHFHLPEESIQLIVDRSGYYPKGGARVQLLVRPLSAQQLFLPGLSDKCLLDPGKLSQITIMPFITPSLASAGQGSIVHRMTDAAVSALKSLADLPRLLSAKDQASINIDKTDPLGAGTGILIIAESTTGCRWAGSALGRKGVRAEKVGQLAAEQLLQSLGEAGKSRGVVDEFMQDQLIIFMALSLQRSAILCGPLSLHTRTAIWVVGQVLSDVKFTVGRSVQDLLQVKGLTFDPFDDSLSTQSACWLLECTPSS